MRSQTIASWIGAASLLCVSLVTAQTLDPAPGLPAGTSIPSINSIRPGIIAPGNVDVELTIYGTHFDERLGPIEVLWDGAPLETVAISATHPESRILATVPGNLLAAMSADDTAAVVIRQNLVALPVDSNAVTVRIGTPPDCASGQVLDRERAACGAALGDIPAIEMVPKHVWYPFVAAPAGGIVRATHRDSLASPEAHTVTSTQAAVKVPPVPGGTDPAFDISLGKGLTGYIRIPEERAPGSVIPFWCTQHGNNMNPPFGGVLVR